MQTLYCTVRKDWVFQENCQRVAAGSSIPDWSASKDIPSTTLVLVLVPSCDEWTRMVQGRVPVVTVYGRRAGGASKIVELGSEMVQPIG